MSSDWKERFKDGISDLDRVHSQPRKVSSQDFTLYKECVMELYERVCSMVEGIPQIEVTRPVVTRSDQFRVDVKGVIETVHALVLKFHERKLELLPEGLNLEQSHGRVRIRHNGKGVSRFLYAALHPDDAPGTFSWYLLDKEKAKPTEELVRLDDAALESILERVFLAT